MLKFGVPIDGYNSGDPYGPQDAEYKKWIISQFDFLNSLSNDYVQVNFGGNYIRYLHSVDG